MKGKLVLGFVVLFVFGFSSFPCYAQSSNNDQRIVGTWTGSLPGWSQNATTTVVFNANGSGIIQITYDGEIKELTFTYGISLGGDIKILGLYEVSFGGVGGISFSLPQGGILYFSPDGKTLIIDNKVYRKR